MVAMFETSAMFIQEVNVAQIFFVMCEKDVLLWQCESESEEKEIM